MRSRTLQGESDPLSPWSLAVMCHLLLALLLLVPVQVNAESPLVARVEMTEFIFRPAVVRLPAGRLVRLVFVNHGQIAHQFETVYLYRTLAVVVHTALRVEANGVEFVRLQPGATATLTFLPRVRGRFPFACTIEGHREAGMVGLLEVQ